MNNDFIFDLNSSLSERGLTIGNRKYEVAVSPISVHDGDRLDFSVYCTKRSDREVKFLEFKIADMKAKPTPEETAVELERTINAEY